MVDTVLILSDDGDDEPDSAIDRPWSTDRPNKRAKHSTHDPATSTNGNKQDQEALAQLDRELASIDKQMKDLARLRQTLEAERQQARRKIDSRLAQSSSTAATVTATAAASSKFKPQATQAVVDYTKSNFSWSKQICKVAKDVWGIESFRHSQEAAINAVLDGRDAMCCLPTGGGKSLLYQIPAILSDTSTVIVITPLLSLMQDQVQNLTSVGVACEQIHGSTPQDEARSIMKRMVGQEAKASSSKLQAGAPSGRPKLVYVTPERIDKSKTFMSTLQKMYDNGSLQRFVIDESHCVSQMGHDYRTSYLSLRRLKALFSDVPILCCSATSPADVTRDVIRTLAMPGQTSPGNAAVPGTTVVFESPLYRPNLKYKVLPKVAKVEDQVSAIATWIKDNHRDDLGIVYCLTQADTEKFARALKLDEKLAAGYYHASLPDEQKLKVYNDWTRGKIKIVVATNASFGLGIDNPHVRYVVHASLPKSLTNHYQESGRAGRDGNEADCVMFWRPSDVSRISTLIYETYWSVMEMVRFALDLKTCRKLLFARAFEEAYKSKTAFEKDGSAQPCGHCDNCERDLDTVETVDVTLNSFRVLKILRGAADLSGTLTLSQATDLVRGLGKGSFATQSSNRAGKGKASIDVVELAGAKVDLDKDTTEMLLVRLLVEGYLEETFYATAYNTISYLSPSARALRFTRFDANQVDATTLPPITLERLSSATSSRSKKRMSVSSVSAKRKKTSMQVQKSDEDEDSDAVAAAMQEIDEMESVNANGRAWSDREGEDEESNFVTRPTELDEDGWQVYA
ncbi:hypothetical protein ACM66B_000198 [Microbotryomycetes sp. NB124-2]